MVNWTSCLSKFCLVLARETLTWGVSCRQPASVRLRKHAGLNVYRDISCVVQAWLVRNAVRLQKEALLFTDERSKLEGELLNGIDVVKCNSWEVCTQVLAPVYGGQAAPSRNKIVLWLLKSSAPSLAMEAAASHKTFDLQIILHLSCDSPCCSIVMHVLLSCGVLACSGPCGTASRACATRS